MVFLSTVPWGGAPDDYYASVGLAGLGCEYCLSDVLENTLKIAC